MFFCVCSFGFWEDNSDLFSEHNLFSILFTAAESQAKDLLALAQDVSKLTAAQIDQLVSQLDKLLSGPTVSKELGDISVNIVSNLLDASPDKLSSSSDRLLSFIQLFPTL